MKFLIGAAFKTLGLLIPTFLDFTKTSFKVEPVAIKHVLSGESAIHPLFIFDKILPKLTTFFLFFLFIFRW